MKKFALIFIVISIIFIIIGIISLFLNSDIDGNVVIEDVEKEENVVNENSGLKKDACLVEDVCTDKINITFNELNDLGWIDFMLTNNSGTTFDAHDFYLVGFSNEEEIIVNISIDEILPGESKEVIRQFNSTVSSLMNVNSYEFRLFEK